LTIFIGVYTDTNRLVLTGLVPFILIASGTLAFPISFVLVRLRDRSNIELDPPRKRKSQEEKFFNTLKTS